MAKMTQKYMRAIEIAEKNNIPLTSDQDALYLALNRAGYQWDPMKKWVDVSQEPAEPASDLLRVRVWAKSEDVEALASKIVRNMTSSGYRLVERSQPYVCRPPKQLESRVYLTFIDGGA